MRWRNTRLLWLCAVAITLCVAACKAPIKGDQPVVSVSLLPEKYFVERMLGDLAEVHVVVPKGSNPETYDPTPRDIAMLQGSKAYLAIGTLPFEEQWQKILPDSVAVVNIASRLPQEMIFAECEGTHDGHTHPLGDPHYWTSVSGGTAMAEVIREALIELFPQHQEEIEANFEQNILPELVQLEQLGEEIFAGRDSLAFVIYHPSLSHFAREWGLTQLVIEEGGTEPSARQLVALMDRAKALETKVVLIQAEYDQRNGETIARELGLPAVIIQPLEENWAGEMRRLMELFR